MLQAGQKSHLIIEAEIPNWSKIDLHKTQYSLTQFIYKTMARQNYEKTKFLHNHGFSFQTGNYKGICFSWPQFSHWYIDTNIKKEEALWVKGKVLLEIRAFINGFIEDFVEGLYKTSIINIADAKLNLLKIKILKPKTFNLQERFVLKTPIVLTKKSKGSVKYLRFLETPDIYIDKMRKNILNKYMACFRQKPYFKDDDIKFNINTISKTKLITYCNQRIYGEMFTMEVVAPQEVMDIIYYMGIGEKNMMGFGFVDIERGV